MLEIDEEEALLDKVADKANNHIDSPAKSTKEVRDSKNSVISRSSNKHATPKRGN